MASHERRLYRHRTIGHWGFADKGAVGPCSCLRRASSQGKARRHLQASQPANPQSSLKYESPQHPLQLPHPLLNPLFDLRQLREDLLRRTMIDLLVHHFFVAVEGEVVALSGDVGLWDAEALGGAGAFALRAVALLPTGEDVGEVVLCVLAFTQCSLRRGAEFLLGEQRCALVVEAPAVGLDVV